jgi:hypothetical protein
MEALACALGRICRGATKPGCPITRVPHPEQSEGWDIANADPDPKRILLPNSG